MRRLSENSLSSTQENFRFVSDPQGMGASLRFGPFRLGLVPGWLLGTWLLFLPALAESQTASLRGQVFDPSGAVVPQATITLTGSSGEPKTATADDHGSYLFTALPPGPYTVQATAPKLEQSPVAITLKPGAQTLRLDLKIAVTQQQTTVQEEGADSSISTESASNASALGFYWGMQG
jgi:Carboxypeptidase regulatory-like domain